MNKYQKILKNWETPFNKTTEQAWAELSPKLSQAPAESGRVVAFNWKPFVSVAAAAAMIVAVVMIWPKSRLIRRETAARQVEAVMLPDQSVMILNAGSVASYKDNWSDERVIELDGQAFFEVKKGQKFNVVTPNGVVEVLGTSFDVYARKDEFRVQCHTGKVLVTSGKSQVMITPGNSADLHEGSLVVGHFDVQQADWQDGEFVYNDEPLQNVFDEIQRQYNVTITAPDLGDRFYTGRFTNKNLEEALELVCVPMGLKFEMPDEKQVVITSAAR